jgi:hypothetical protein
MPEVVWQFSKIGDAELKKAIATLGEDGVRAQAAQQAAQERADAEWRKAMNARLGVSRNVTAEMAAQERATAKASSDAAKKAMADAKAVAKIREDEAKKAAAAQEASIKKVEDAAVASARRIAMVVPNLLGGIGKRLISDLGAGWMTSLSGLSGKVIDGISGAVRESMKLQGIARRIAIDARRPGEKLTNVSALRREFEETAIANPGMKAEDVAAGVGAFREKSGSLPDARKYADVIAKVSQATGKGTEEIGALAGKLHREFKIKDVNEMGDALAAVAARAKVGGVSFEQAASQLQLASGRAKGAGYDIERLGVRGMNALLGAAGEGGDPERSGQAVGMFMSKLTSQATKLKGTGKGGLGLDVYSTEKDEHGQAKIRPIQDIMAEMFVKARAQNTVKGDETNAVPMKLALDKIFGGGGRGQPGAVMTPMLDAFNKAYASTQGTEKEKAAAGASAVKAKFDELAAASGDYKDLLQDVNTVQATGGAQMEAAWQSLVQAVGKEMVPTLTGFMKEIGANKGLWEALAGSVGLLGTAVRGVVAFLQALHLVSGGEHTNAMATYAQERQEALSQYAALGEEKPGESKETSVKRRLLKKRIVDASRFYVGEEEAALDSGEQSKGRTQVELMAMYAKLKEHKQALAAYDEGGGLGGSGDHTTTAAPGTTPATGSPTADKQHAAADKQHAAADKQHAAADAIGRHIATLGTIVDRANHGSGGSVFSGATPGK